MNGKQAKRLRRLAVSVAFSRIQDTSQTTAPGVVTDLPAHSLLKDQQTGTLIVPPTCGRFWYKQLKRFGLAGYGRNPLGALGEVRERSLRLLES